MSTLVVIAEHDQSVRDCMVDALEYNGYRVAAFEEAAEATPFMKSHADSVGLVIVGSQARKHLSRIELLRASKSDYHLPVVVGPEALAKQSADLSLADAVLPAQWHLDDLLRVCRTVLRKDEKVSAFLASERKRLS